MALPRWMQAAIRKVRHFVSGSPDPAANQAAAAQQFPTLPPAQQALIGQGAAQMSQQVQAANAAQPDEPLVVIHPDDVIIDDRAYQNVAVEFRDQHGRTRYRTFQVPIRPNMTVGEAREEAFAMADEFSDQYPGSEIAGAAFM